LIISKPARAALARASGSLVALAVVVGLTTAGAYAIGGLARAAVVHAKIVRLAGAASSGFSENALETVAFNDPSAVSVARRFDPNPAPQDTAVARQQRLAELADRLQARRTAPDHGAAAVTRASYASVVPVRPFYLRGALEESRDLECLTQAVYYEARGESAAGQAAVAQVVLNRTRHPAFPNTVCGVVFQGARIHECQFSFACDGSVTRRVDLAAWRRAERVAARALDGAVMAAVGNATHFHIAQISPGWGPRLLRVAQVGAHVFYRFGGRAGSRNALTDTPEPSPPLPPPAPEAKPVYASLSLAPLANTVANSVATSVAGAAQAGAELVMAAAGPKPAPAKPAKPAAPAEAKPAAAGAIPAPAVMVAPPLTPAMPGPLAAEATPAEGARTTS
jgi:spore germination cell wall hydrolase CwlJ-like protein